MKRRFQLTGAVLSIIVGALSILGGLIVLYIISMFSAVPDIQALMLISAVVVLALGIAIVILGALLCKKKKSHGVAIALLC